MAAAEWKSEKSLTTATVGSSGLVSHFTNDRVAGKLISMGVLPGTLVKIIRKAPFGGTCYIKADNLLLALRKDEACSIVLR